jgi:hypothetical protein
LPTKEQDKKGLGDDKMTTEIRSADDFKALEEMVIYYDKNKEKILQLVKRAKKMATELNDVLVE